MCSKAITVLSTPGKIYQVSGCQLECQGSYALLGVRAGRTNLRGRGIRGKEMFVCNCAVFLHPHEPKRNAMFQAGNGTGANHKATGNILVLRAGCKNYPTRLHHSSLKRTCITSHKYVSSISRLLSTIVVCLIFSGPIKAVAHSYICAVLGTTLAFSLFLCITSSR